MEPDSEPPELAVLTLARPVKRNIINVYIIKQVQVNEKQCV